MRVVPVTEKSDVCSRRHSSFDHFTADAIGTGTAQTKTRRDPGSGESHGLCSAGPSPCYPKDGGLFPPFSKSAQKKTKFAVGTWHRVEGA